MGFENKGQYLFTQKQAYEMMKGLNKTLREKGISDENQMSQVQQQVGPRTVAKQSGFCR